jgi:Trypsin-like peptidase domain
MRSATVRLLPFVVLCVLAGAAGCGGDSKPKQPATLSKDRRLSLSVVAVEARIGGDEVRSSGTVIDGARGLVLTSAHSVWGATDLRVTTGIGVLHGRVLARAPCDDLALLETQPRLPGLAGLPGAGTPQPSAVMTSVGRRASGDYGPDSLLEIPVRATESTPHGIAALRLPGLQHAVPLDSDLVVESTGGPLLDRRGRPVAMAVVAGSPNGRTTAVALPWDTVKQRIAELRPGPQRVFVGWRSQYRCVARMQAFIKAAHPAFQPRDAKLIKPITVSRLPGTEELDP